MTWVLDSTRIKQTFLRPTSDYGTSVPLWTTGFRRFCVTAVWGFLFLASFAAEAAFNPPPKASVKALKITKGKPFENGVVFIDGKYVAPPYVVERYGNVIRINGIQATQPVVDWSEFLKTQPAAVITKTEKVAEEPASPAPAPAAPADAAAAAATLSSDDDSDPLADLFDDAPAKPKSASAAPASVPAPAPKPTVTTTVKLEGEFEMNDRAKGLVAKVNVMRRDIDAALRRGGFFCFGSSYSRISGDKTLSFRIMEKIPVIMKQHSDFAGFSDAVRQSGFVYFPPHLVRDLFANRLDYLTLQKRWKKMKDNAELDQMLERAGSSSF